ncbi:mitochondrial import receptor subunit TOM6 homolog [Myiozetetes cayanensis]|uniref:mitochondrial import receptor subunit TOM6 homolog n=1 Tax=Myiozetetes cayanensis TaxID=478635 RepID=UPI00215EC5E8|nr:mitochondrial import receptor subunit TOM6 homolog [Myiozetetes cayanensis]
MAAAAGAGPGTPGPGPGAGSGSGPVAAPPRGLRAWLRSAFRFATDRNDFRRNLLVNLGLFAAGVWVARNLTDIDLMAPQPVP